MEGNVRTTQKHRNISYRQPPYPPGCLFRLYPPRASVSRVPPICEKKTNKGYNGICTFVIDSAEPCALADEKRTESSTLITLDDNVQVMPDPITLALVIAVMTLAIVFTGFIVLLRRFFNVLTTTNKNVEALLSLVNAPPIITPPIEELDDDYFEKLREAMVSPGTITSSNIPTASYETLTEKLTPLHDHTNEDGSEQKPTNMSKEQWTSLGQTTDGAQIFIKPTSKEDVRVWEANPPTPTPPPENAAEIDIETHTLRPAGTLPPKARHGK